MEPFGTSIELSFALSLDRSCAYSPVLFLFLALALPLYFVRPTPSYALALSLALSPCFSLVRSLSLSLWNARAFCLLLLSLTSRNNERLAILCQHVEFV